MVFSRFSVDEKLFETLENDNVDVEGFLFLNGVKSLSVFDGHQQKI